MSEDYKVVQVPRSEVQSEKSWWSRPESLLIVALLSLFTLAAIYLAPRIWGEEEVAATFGYSGCQIDEGVLTAPLPTESGDKQWREPFPMLIDTRRDYVATLQTTRGPIVIDLLESDAPNTVNNFVALAASGYYDNTPFHRVLDDFMAQGGDPTGTGRGGPGYSFADEQNGLTFDGAGIVAMANGGPNTNGSQFFITYAPTPHLNGAHTIFGRVIDGQANADALTRIDPQRPDPNVTADRIECVSLSLK